MTINRLILKEIENKKNIINFELNDRNTKSSLELLTIVINHIVNYPTSVNLSYMWNFGSISGIFLVIQILTGIFFTMHYQVGEFTAFHSLEHIMRDVFSVWFLRYGHSNGASFFFNLINYFFLLFLLLIQIFLDLDFIFKMMRGGKGPIKPNKVINFLFGASSLNSNNENNNWFNNNPKRGFGVMFNNENDKKIVDFNNQTILKGLLENEKFNMIIIISKFGNYKTNHPILITPYEYDDNQKEADFKNEPMDLNKKLFNVQIVKSTLQDHKGKTLEKISDEFLFTEKVRKNEFEGTYLTPSVPLTVEQMLNQNIIKESSKILDKNSLRTQLEEEKVNQNVLNELHKNKKNEK